jgi:hypothetical protein
MSEVVWLLEWFAADGSLAGEAVMPTAQLAELQALFGALFGVIHAGYGTRDDENRA